MKFILHSFHDVFMYCDVLKLPANKGNILVTDRKTQAFIRCLRTYLSVKLQK